MSVAFLSAALCYWLVVFPKTKHEVRYWRTWAATIPDPHLRRLAFETHRSKWSNIEGATAFATLAPAAHRNTAIRTLVAFQAAYDYADTVSEQPATESAANGRLLHSPLALAFEQDTACPDFYRHSLLKHDGDYLKALTVTCRQEFNRLPSHELVRAAVVRAARRIIGYQSLNHNGKEMFDQMKRWATSETTDGSGLYWWETAAACASSLTVLALIAAAADPMLTIGDAQAIESAYHPWVGALHTLLDSLVDWRQDELAGQPSLLDGYASLCELAERIRLCVRRAQAAVQILPRRHAVILAGMIGVYLATPEARTQRTRHVADGVLEAMGPLATASVAVIKIRRAVSGG